MAALDRAAIDEARHDRRELPRGHGDHRLVEQSEALVRPAQNDQEVAHRLLGDRHQLRVAKALTDLGGLPRSLDGAIEIARRLLPHGDGQQQVAASGAVALGPLHLPLGAGQPTAGPADALSQHQVDAEPDGAPQGVVVIAAVEIAMVGALERLNLFVAVSEHAGGGRQ